MIGRALGRASLRRFLPVLLAGLLTLLLSSAAVGRGTVVPETSITQHPNNPTTETSAHFEYSSSEADSTFQCSLDDSAFDSCPSGGTTYSVGVGRHKFEVYAIDPAGDRDESPDSFSWTVEAPPDPDPDGDDIVGSKDKCPNEAEDNDGVDDGDGCPENDPPTNTCRQCSPPSISGTPMAGRKLTANRGRWTGEKNKYSYQWQHCSSGGCSNVRGGGSSYSLDAGDIGFKIRVIVTASNKEGSSEAASGETNVVVAAPNPPVNQSLPTMVGSAVERERLSGDRGRWSGSPPIAFAYRWLRCNSSGGRCSPIRGGRGRTYRLTRRDVGSTIRFEVTASNSGGSKSAASSATKQVKIFDVTRPQTVIRAKPRNPTNALGAVFRFTSEPGSRFVCKLNALPFARCSSGKTYPRLRVGLHTFQVRATDRAGNVENTPAVYRWRIDRVPPGRVRRVALRAGDRIVRIAWTLPRTADLARVVVKRFGSAPRVVYRRLGRVMIDRRVVNGHRYRYAIMAFDRAGNRSIVWVAARPRDPLLAPREGRAVTRPPLLRWKRAPRASYYNVQLWRKSGARWVRVLSAWPAAPRLQLRSHWRYGGPKRLVPGRYQWYVWPGYGARSLERYGARIGTSAFVVRRAR